MIIEQSHVLAAKKNNLRFLSQNVSKPCRFGVIKLIINGHICGQKGGA